MVALVAQFVPSAQVPVGVQLAGPAVKEAIQPAGNAGGVTPLKLSDKKGTQGLGGVAVAVGVEVGVGVGVAVAVAVAVGVGVPVHTSGEGPCIPTVIGAPVLKKPIVALAAWGGRLESNRKLYNVPQRMAFAFWFCAKVSVFQLTASEV